MREGGGEVREVREEGREGGEGGEGGKEMKKGGREEVWMLFALLYN